MRARDTAWFTAFAASRTAERDAGGDTAWPTAWTTKEIAGGDWQTEHFKIIFSTNFI